MDSHNEVPDLYFGPGNKILGQDHRILVFFCIRFEVTSSSVQSLGVPTQKVHLVHQNTPDLKTQMPNLKNPENIINISTSRPTFTVSFLGFIRSLSDISINPLFCVPGGLGRRRAAECHRNVIIRPPETFSGWNRSECPSNALDVEVVGFYGYVYMEQSACFIPHYTPSPSWSLECETHSKRVRQNS